MILISKTSRNHVLPRTCDNNNGIYGGIVLSKQMCAVQPYLKQSGNIIY